MIEPDPNGSFIAPVVPDNVAARVAEYLGVVHGEAFIGVDFDYEVLGEKNGMMMVAVGGTAVNMA